MKRGFNLFKQLKLFLVLIIILSIFLFAINIYLAPSFSPTVYSDSKLDEFSKESNELEISDSKLGSGSFEDVDEVLRGSEGYVCDFRPLSSSLARCFGDADRSGIVNAGDRGVISANIGRTEPSLICAFDLDGNGVINAGDQGFVSANIGRCTPLPDYQDGSGCNQGVCPDPRFLDTHSVCTPSGQCVPAQGHGEDECQYDGECDSETCLDSDGFNPFSVGYVTMSYERAAPSYSDTCVDGIALESLCREDEPGKVYFHCADFGGSCGGDGECTLPSYINLLPSCDFLSTATIESIQQLLYNDGVIQLIEGGNIFDSEDTPEVYLYSRFIPPYHYLFPSSQRILSIENIINTEGWENDRVVLKDFVSSETFEATITSDGVGTLAMEGTVYPINYGRLYPFGANSYISDYVTIDYPQTTGNDRLEFFSCGWQ